MKFLSHDPYTQYNIRTLSKYLKVKSGTLRVTLRRLAKDNLILNPSWGFYQHPSGLVREELDLLMRFHAIKLESRKGWSYPNLFKIVTTRFANPERHIHSRNKGITTKGEWESRGLTLTLHKNEFEVFMQSSDMPLSLLDMTNYLSYICGATGIIEQFWLVTQCDYNIDQVGKVDMPVGSISIASFKDMIVKFYEKKIGLIRTEVRSFEKLGADKILNNVKVILKMYESIKR